MVRSGYPTPVSLSSRRGGSGMARALNLQRAADYAIQRALRGARGPTMVQEASRRGRAMRMAAESSPTPQNVRRVLNFNSMIGRKAKVTGKSAGKYKKWSKLKRKGRNYKRQLGICTAVETGAVLTDPNSIYVGHTSMPGYQILLTAIQSLVKSLVFKTYNYQIENMSDVWAEAELPRIDINYYASFASTGVGSISVTPLVTDTYYQTATTLTGSICTQLASTPNIIFKWARMYRTSTSVTTYNTEIDLEFTTLDIYCKSSLKTQNRSAPSAANQEADDVDNVPIYGRSYEASGTGLLLRDSQRGNSATQSFGCDARHGSLTYVGASDATQSLREPPFGTLFSNVKKVGKVKLDPGEIKTSVLVFKRKMKFNNFIVAILRQLIGLSAGVYRQYVSLGQSRAFGFEKLLDDGGVTNMSLAYEINENIQVSLFSFKPLPTMLTYIKY